MSVQESQELDRFYAVTVSPSGVVSLYLVLARKDKESPWPCVRKIGLRGESKIGEIGVGDEIAGSMLSISWCLQFYTPGGSELGHTSPIVALFLDEEKARKCFEFSKFVPYDPRWRNQTSEAIDSIGDDHPTITVCRESLALLFSES